MVATRHELYVMAINYLDAIITEAISDGVTAEQLSERVTRMAEVAKQAIHEAYEN